MHGETEAAGKTHRPAPTQGTLPARGHPGADGRPWHVMGSPGDVTPGVSSFSRRGGPPSGGVHLPGCLPERHHHSRMAGRTPVPEGEALPQDGQPRLQSMVLFLSTGLLEEVERELMAGDSPRHPGGHRLKATWPEVAGVPL